MAMTTTTEKLRARAAELEQQAAALRLAADVLDQDVLGKKQATAGKELRAAAALRKAQTNGHGGAPEETPTQVSARQAQRTRATSRRDLIVEIIRSHETPIAFPDLKAAAQSEGVKDLVGIGKWVDNGLLKRTGKGEKARYSLGPRAAEGGEE